MATLNPTEIIQACLYFDTCFCNMHIDGSATEGKGVLGFTVYACYGSTFHCAKRNARQSWQANSPVGAERWAGPWGTPFEGSHHFKQSLFKGDYGTGTCKSKSGPQACIQIKELAPGTAKLLHTAAMHQ